MVHHYKSLDKDHDKKRSKTSISPSSKNLLKLLLKYTAIGSFLLCCLTVYHGRSFKSIFISGEAQGNYYPAGNDEVNVEEEQENEELLSSPGELLIEMKENQMAKDTKEKLEMLKEMEEELPNELVEIDTSNFGSTRLVELGDILFSDGKEFSNAPIVEVGGLLPDPAYHGMWSLQKMHDDLFQRIEHRSFLPHVAEPITKLQFHQTFRQTSTAAIFPFETLRNHGFLTKAYSLDELRARFPYEPPKNGKLPLAYTSKSGQKAGLDLGPALYALEQDFDLAKGKGFKRNFPRNLKLKSKYLSLLEISHPPFVPKHRFQPPTLWFGTSSADTRLHSDCCDNFVQMISGTKRWYIAPPTDSRHLRPIVCEGKHQSLCWAGVKFPSGPKSRDMTAAEKKKLGVSHGFVVDIHAGEMLYLPAGWWHHIENLGPTIMVNFWTFGCENVAVALDEDPTRADRSDFFKCPAIAQADAAFLYSN